jgi:hypothetical protein
LKLVCLVGQKTRPEGIPTRGKKFGHFMAENRCRKLSYKARRLGVGRVFLWLVFIC